MQSSLPLLLDKAVARVAVVVDAVLLFQLLNVFEIALGVRAGDAITESGRPKSRLAILPGLTHYNIFSAPALASTVVLFLDEPAAKDR